MIDELKTFSRFGYTSDELSGGSHKRIVAVCDKCGYERDVENKQYHDLCHGCATGSYEHRAKLSDAISKAHLAEKLPLPYGFVSTGGLMETNKECGAYLGCFIAERVLEMVFSEVTVMPYGNHGFDFVCNRGYRVDAKGATLAKRYNGWMFNIRRNTIADYFLCIAFKDRESLIPVHLWLVPGHILNRLRTTSISLSTLSKWEEYELPIDKTIKCCDSIRTL